MQIDSLLFDYPQFVRYSEFEGFLFNPSADNFCLIRNLIKEKFTEEDYSGYVLSTDEDIDEFFATFNLSPDKTNQLIDVTGVVKPIDKIASLLQELLN